MHNGGEKERITWLRRRGRRDERDEHAILPALPRTPQQFPAIRAQGFGDMIPCLIRSYCYFSTVTTARVGGAGKIILG